MNAYEQAQHFLEEAQYDSFFALLRHNNIENGEIAKIRLEFSQGTKDVLFFQRLGTLLTTYKDELKTPLPAEEQTKQPIFLASIPAMQKFIGRKDELKALHEHLQNNLPTVVVNGIGGIGKTSLAREYIHQNRHEYDHILWLEQTGEAINAFTDNTLLQARLQLAFQQETEEQRLEAILGRLQQIQGTNLLVLDNYQRTPETDSPFILTHFPFAPHWRVLFTSREEVTDFTPITLDTLSKNEAIELFKMHATGKDIDEEALRKLLHDIGWHTLMIELLAKNYKANSGLQSISDFAQKIEAREIDADILQRKLTAPHTKGEIRLYTYLLKVFSLDALDDKALHLLRQIAVLPAELLPIGLILDTKHEEEETYREALEDLAKRGWLALIAGKEVQMHRLVQLVLLKTLLPTYANCEELCNIIANILASDQAKANPLQHQGFTPLAESLLQHIDFQDAQDWQAKLQHELALFYQYAGNYPKSIAIAQQNLLLAEQVYDKDSQQYPAILNNLASLYKSIGKYEEALPLYQESLQIREKVLGKQHSEYATTLNNLAGLYKSIGKYEEALPLYQESLQIREQVLGKQHSEYATTLNNLANLYQITGRYEEALPLYQESKQIREQVVGKQHPEYAQSLNNLAGLYESIGKNEEALPLYQECLQIQAQVLGTQHPEFASTLYNMGELLIQMQRVEAGIQAIFTAYQLLQENVGDEHPYTKNVKEVVDYLRSTLNI